MSKKSFKALTKANRVYAVAQNNGKPNKDGKVLYTIFK